MEFDPTNSDQRITKPTNRTARFRMIATHQESPCQSYCLNSSDMPSGSASQPIKKMKLDSYKTELFPSVVTGEVSDHKRRSDSNTTHQDNRYPKKQLFNMIPSTQTATMSTVVEQSMHNGRRGGNFTEYSEQPCVSIAAEEVVSSLKPSTTTAMPGREEETVYNGKRGRAFLFSDETMVSFQEQSNREVVRATQNGLLTPSGQGGTVSNGPANNPNQASTSCSSQKRKRDRFETIVPAVSSEQSGIPPDGYIWWKSGAKWIKGSPHQRSYYKCMTQKAKKCLAKKQVMKVSDDPSMLKITYKNEHTHPPLQTTTSQSNTNNNLPDNFGMKVLEPFENETHVTTHLDLNIDMNVPASLEDHEMRVEVPHVVTNLDMNLPPSLENEMHVEVPRKVLNLDMNLPPILENEMDFMPHKVLNFDMNFPPPLETDQSI